ncbi:MAG TPA: peptidylprolyl isomerase [Geothermobacteraceae bacterium]|nr:peptidylprolyl isomerase [Geothermobacteraceae bacterium]
MGKTIIRSLLVAVFLLPPLLGGCQEKTSNLPPVLFQVDGRVVTLEQFQKAFRNTLPSGKNLTSAEISDLQRAYLVQAIDRELILAEADRLGVTVSSAEIETALTDARRDYDPGEFDKRLKDRGMSLDEWRLELRDGLLIEKVVRLAAYPRAKVSDADVAAEFEQHRDDFERPEQVRARQILVDSVEEGERLLGLLRSGEPFAKVASQYSLSPDSEQGGDLGFFARGEMPAEFDDTVFSLPVGRISELVKSPYGVHIFLVEEKREAKRLSLEDAAAEIRAQLLRRAEETVYQQWLQELRARAVININMALLAETNP